MNNKQRDRSQLIKYKPSILMEYDVMAYEWIDNLCFTLDPLECVSNANEYIKIVKNKFLNAGWYGDGKIELIWIPPFMFDGKRTEKFTKGKIVWHVKQKEDGISWILHEKDFFDNVIVKD
jgi:hypothetical protein